MICRHGVPLAQLCYLCLANTQETPPAPAAPEVEPQMDEAEQAAQEWLDTYGIPDSVEAVADLIRTHNAAGRKAGEAAMRERCERIAMDHCDCMSADDWTPDRTKHLEWCYGASCADAIAKETK